MRFLNIRILPFVVLACFASPVFADFGGALDNATSVTKEEDTVFEQKNSLSLWGSAYIGDELRFDAAARATVSSESPHFYGDIERLVLSGDFAPREGGPQLNFELGKFLQSDFSSVVLAQPTAGLGLGFSYPLMDLKLVLGYTGLNNKDASSLAVSKLDALDAADDDAYFAPPRFIGSATLTFPELFARQTVTVSAIVQEDLRARFDTVIEEGEEGYNPTSGGTVDTQYWGIGLAGPLAPSLYYDLYAYLGTGRTLTFEDDDQSTTGQAYVYEPILAWLFGASVRYYLPDFYKSFASAKVLYASGDDDHVGYFEGNTEGNSTAFVPLADGPFGLAFQPDVSNLLALELSYSIKPLASSGDSLLSTLQAVAKATSFFKAAGGPLSEAAVDSAEDAGYLGTELDGSVNLRPFSDLGLGLSLGIFMPNSSMFVEGMDDPWFIGEFTFSFSF